MICASLIGAMLAVSFPVEWNTTYDASVPYEVEIAPDKLGISGGSKYSVLADGQEIGTSLLPGKFDGTVRLRFSVPHGTRKLTCSASNGSMQGGFAAGDLIKTLCGLNTQRGRVR